MVASWRVGRKDLTFYKTLERKPTWIISSHSSLCNFIFFYFHYVLYFNPLNFKKQIIKYIPHRTLRKIYLLYSLIVLSFTSFETYENPAPRGQRLLHLTALKVEPQVVTLI